VLVWTSGIRSSLTSLRADTMRAVCAILGVATILSACTPIAQRPADYLERAVGRQTQKEVESHLGPPLMQVPADRGATIWIYRYAGVRADGPSAIEQLWCYEHALTFGRDKVLKDWKRRDCQQAHQGP
jgi:hypothetical protein